MKTDNVFKFVSLRPPNETSERRSVNSNPTPTPSSPPIPTPRSIPNPERVRFLESIRNRMSSRGTFEEARLELAKEFLESGNYVVRNRNWQRLLPLENSIKTLLEDAKIASNIENLSERLFALLGFDQQNGILSDKYRKLREALWHSYLSNLILNVRRPHDRISLLFWIRLFHLMENLYDEPLARLLLENFNQLRATVSVDLVWVKTPPLKEVPLSDPQANLNERTEIINENKKAITELNDLKMKLRKIFEKKIRNPPEDNKKFQDYPQYSSKKRDMDVKGQEEGGSSDIPYGVMYFRISISDLDAETLGTLTKYGINFENLTEVRMMERIENLTAKKFTAIYLLERVKSFKIMRGVLVKVTRKI